MVVMHRVLASNQLTDALNYWTKPGDVVANPSITDASQKVNLASDKFLEKGDYITLRDMVIGYTLPSSITRKLGINSFPLLTFREPIYGWEPSSGEHLK